MFYLGFAIRNPFMQRFDAIWGKVVKVSKNKTIEIGLYKTNEIIGTSFTVTGFKQDHKGFSFDLGLFGYNFDFQFLDNRHHEYY